MILQIIIYSFNESKAYLQNKLKVNKKQKDALKY